MGRALVLALLAVAAGSVAAQEGGLGAIKSRGYLRVCADPSNPPFSSENDATPGFEVELAREVARELGVGARFEWNPTYRRALRPLREGRCELFMGLPADEEFIESNPWLAVSRPYYVMGHAIVARADAGVRSLADLAGKRIAVDAQSPGDSYVFYAGHNRGIYPSQEQAFEAVASREAAAAVIWMPIAGWLALGKPELSVIPLSDSKLEFPIGAGVRKRDGLAAAVDEALARLTANGKVRETLLRYGAIPAQRPASSTLERPGFIRVGAKDPVDAGRTLYSTACSRCHGPEGAGAGPGLATPVLKSYAGGEERFVRIVKQGRPNTPMGPFKNILTEEEIKNLYLFLTSFSKE